MNELVPDMVPSLLQISYPLALLHALNITLSPMTQPLIAEIDGNIVGIVVIAVVLLLTNTMSINPSQLLSALKYIKLVVCDMRLGVDIDPEQSCRSFVPIDRELNADGDLYRAQPRSTLPSTVHR